MDRQVSLAQNVKMTLKALGESLVHFCPSLTLRYQTPPKTPVRASLSHYEAYIPIASGWLTGNKGVEGGRGVPFKRTVERIDVLWIKGRSIIRVTAFGDFVIDRHKQKIEARSSLAPIWR